MAISQTHAKGVITQASSIRLEMRSYFDKVMFRMSYARNEPFLNVKMNYRYTGELELESLLVSLRVSPFPHIMH